MKAALIFAFTAGALVAPISVGATPVNFFEQCNAYRYTERYQSGYYDNAGNYVQGRVKVSTQEIPCHTGVNIFQHQVNNYPPVHQQQTYPQQHILPVTAQEAPASCSNKVVRMGIGGLLGGTAGYYAVGGKKSSKTILGSSVGSVVGALLGRVSC